MKLFYNLFFIAIISLVTTTTNDGCKSKEKAIEQPPAKAEAKVEKENPLTELLKGLRPLTTNELDGRMITIDGISMPVYNHKGEKMAGMELIEAHQDSTNYFEIYGTDELEPVAVLVRPKEKIKTGVDDNNTFPMPEEPMAVKLEYAPAFSIADMDGNTVDLKSLEGKIVVLNFWFTRCPPCVDEIPELNSLVKKYKNNKDIVFLALTFDDKAVVSNFLKDNSFNYTILPSAQSVLDDYIVIGYPSNMVLNKKGDIQYQSMGYRHKIGVLLDNEIKFALKEAKKKK